MIVQFPDYKSLALAHQDLLKLGVPEQRITPYFEEREPDQVDASDHDTFLKQLHGWVHDASKCSFAGEQAEIQVPTSALFLRHGGTLSIKCPQLEHAILEIILRHDGRLVG